MPIGNRSCPAWTFPGGMFGENFSTVGLVEDDLHIGDCFKIGSSTVMVRQPRIPCYKLAAKFQRDDILEQFLLSGRSGFYFSVEQEGEVAAGNSFELLTRDHDAITIAEMNRLFVREKYDRGLLHRALNTAALPDEWRHYFSRRLDAASAS